MSKNKPCRVWCKFDSKNKKFRIQDMPSDRFDDVLELFANYFVKEETMHKVAGIYKSEEALAECREFIPELMKECNSITICCLDDEEGIVGEIIGASLMVLSKKDDPEEDVDFKTRTKELGRMFELMGNMFSLYDVMKEFKLDTFYDDRGIVVHPKFRGYGIAQKLFSVRRMVCRENNVPMTGAWVTSFGSQKAAERDGWETVFEVSYEEFGKKHGVQFENVPPTCKFMVAKIQNS